MITAEHIIQNHIRPLEAKNTAKKVITLRWRVWFVLSIVVLFVLSFLFERTVAPALMLLACINFGFLLYFRFRLIFYPTRIVGENDYNATEVAEHELPTFTLLLPMKQEGSIIHATLDAVLNLDYPQELLEILVIVEETDEITRQSLSTYQGDVHKRLEIVLIKEEFPFTKGRGMQQMLARATGEYITVFDAESKPDSQQVRKAAALLVEYRKSHIDIVAQAVIRIENAGTNLLTKFFAAEYIEWFYKHMDRNAQYELPMGLAGNSFYIRTDVVREVGGWDPYNVTEDADLTVRLIERGIKFVRLDSETLEPCPDTFSNWAKQRTRWNKGLLMTKMIHLSQNNFGFKRMQARQWGAFWGRMFCGSLVPLAVFHSLVMGTYFKHFGGPEITDTINHILAANFFVSLAVSMTADYIHFRAAKIPISFLKLGLGTLMYWTFYLYAGFAAYYEYIVAPLKWNKTDHDAIV